MHRNRKTHNTKRTVTVTVTVTVMVTVMVMAKYWIFVSSAIRAHECSLYFCRYMNVAFILVATCYWGKQKVLSRCTACMICHVTYACMLTHARSCCQAMPCGTAHFWFDFDKRNYACLAHERVFVPFLSIKSDSHASFWLRLAKTWYMGIFNGFQRLIYTSLLLELYRRDSHLFCKSQEEAWEFECALHSTVMHYMCMYKKMQS